MRLDREATEGLREKLSAAVLLAAIVLLRTANAQQSVAPAAGSPQADATQADASHAASPHRGLPEIYQRLFSDEAARGGRPADPAEQARLRYGGKSFRDWQELYLTDLEPATRLKALPALTKLGQYGYGREAAETIAAAFVDQDSEFVDEAIKAAAAVGPEAVPALVELCQKNRGRVRRNAAQALAKMGQGAADAAAPLFDVLRTIDGTREDDELDQYYVQNALYEIGPAQIPVLLERLESPDRNTRVLAAHLAGRIGYTQLGPAKPQITLLLRKAFKDENPAARAIVGAALWKVAPEDERVVETLRIAITSDELRVAAMIVDAIQGQFASEVHSENFDEASAGPAFANGASLIAEAMRLPAFWRGDWEWPTEPSERYEPVKPWEFAGIAGIERMESKTDFATSVYAAMIRIGPHAKSLVPEFVRLARTGRDDLAAAAVNGLGQIGGNAAPALPALRELIERRQKQGVAVNDQVLESLIQAVQQIESTAPPVVEIPEVPVVR